MSFYEVTADPYCYEGTEVLINIPGIRNAEELEAFELEATLLRSGEPLEIDTLSAIAYQNIHQHLFQDVYAWAGEYRSVRISKGGNAFCYPENIESEMQRLFSGLEKDKFYQGNSPQVFAEKTAYLLSTLNAIHPFREGNGRVQHSFLSILASKAGYFLNWEKMEPQVFKQAVIETFNGSEAPVTQLIYNMLEE